MSILPEGTQLRKAIRWLSDERLNNPGASLFKLIDEASLRFDLPPKDEQFLLHFFSDSDSKESE